MAEGLAPPTRAVVHSHFTICRRLRIQYVFLHMCGVNQFWIIVFFAAVKPANNILLCIELIQRPESSLRRHKLGLTDQSIRSNADKTRFTCVHRLMIDRTFPKHMQKSAWRCSVTYSIWQFKFDCSFILKHPVCCTVKETMRAGWRQLIRVFSLRMEGERQVCSFLKEKCLM